MFEFVSFSESRKIFFNEETILYRDNQTNELVELSKVSGSSLLPLLEKIAETGLLLERNRSNINQHEQAKKVYRVALLAAVDIFTDYWLEKAVESMKVLIPMYPEEAAFYFGVVLQITARNVLRNSPLDRELDQLSSLLGEHLDLFRFRRQVERHITEGDMLFELQLKPGFE